MIRPLVSIIVTAYKVEKYFDACLRSVVEQSYDSLQCIVVVDGSPDRCDEIADHYERHHPDIFHIKKIPNSGVSAARNKGIEFVKGDFLIFLDGDDRLAPNYIQVLVETAVKKYADIVIAAMDDCFDDGSIRSSYLNRNFSSDGLVEKKSALNYIPVCGKLFRFDRVRDISFPVGLLHEDNYYSVAALNESRNVYVVTHARYLRTIRGSGHASITQSLSLKSFLNYLDCLVLSLGYLKNRGSDTLFVFNLISGNLFGIFHYKNVLKINAWSFSKIFLRNYLIPLFLLFPIMSLFGIFGFFCFAGKDRLLILLGRK